MASAFGDGREGVMALWRKPYCSHSVWGLVGSSCTCMCAALLPGSTSSVERGWHGFSVSVHTRCCFAIRTRYYPPAADAGCSGSKQAAVACWYAALASGWFSHCSLGSGSRVEVAHGSSSHVDGVAKCTPVQGYWWCWACARILVVLGMCKDTTLVLLPPLLMHVQGEGVHRLAKAKHCSVAGLG